MNDDSKTRMEAVYRGVRHAVITGVLKPGQRVRLADLCEQYDVSLGVVREAATRLAEQGLFHAEPNRGFRVLMPSIDDLRDLTFVRIEIETLCLRRSIAQGGDAWEAGIVSAHHVMTRTARQVAESQQSEADADISRAQAHSAFHAALAAACGSPRLIELRQRLFDSAALYRHWSANLSAAARQPKEEHRKLMQACLDRDADAAVNYLERHISGTTNWLIDRAKSGSEPPWTPAGKQPAARIRA